MEDFDPASIGAKPVQTEENFDPASIGAKPVQTGEDFDPASIGAKQVSAPENFDPSSIGAKLDVDAINARVESDPNYTPDNEEQRALYEADKNRLFSQSVRDAAKGAGKATAGAIKSAAKASASVPIEGVGSGVQAAENFSGGNLSYVKGYTPTLSERAWNAAIPLLDYVGKNTASVQQGITDAAVGTLALPYKIGKNILEGAASAGGREGAQPVNPNQDEEDFKDWSQKYLTDLALRRSQGSSAAFQQAIGVDKPFVADPDTASTIALALPLLAGKAPVGATGEAMLAAQKVGQGTGLAEAAIANGGKAAAQTVGERAAGVAGAAAEKVGGAARKVGALPRQMVTKAASSVIGPELAEKAVPIVEGTAAFHNPLVKGVVALEAGGAAAEKVGQAAQQLASTPTAGPFGRLINLAKGDAPDWLKNLASNPAVQKIYGAASAAAPTIKGGVKGFTKGAALGTGLSALSGDSPEETGANAMMFGAFGASHGAEGARDAQIYNRRAAGVMDLVGKNLSDGVSPDTLKQVPDAAMLAAADIQYLGIKDGQGRDLQVKFYGKDSPVKDAQGNSDVRASGGDGFYDSNNHTVYLNADKMASNPGASWSSIFHEVMHPLFESEVANRPEISAQIDKVVKDAGLDLNTAKQNYTRRLLQPELDAAKITDPAEIQARIKAFTDSADAHSLQTRGDADHWIRSEILSDAARDLLGTEKGMTSPEGAIAQALKPTAAGIMQGVLEKMGVNFSSKAAGKTVIPGFDNVVSDPSLRKTVRNLLKEQRKSVPGITKAADQSVKLNPADMGTPKAPFHDLPNGRRGNKYAEEVSDGKGGTKVVMRNPGQVRKIERAEQKAIRKYIQPGQRVSKLPDAFYNDPDIGPWTKQAARAAEDSAANGVPYEAWYHGIGESGATDWKKSVRSKLGNVMASRQKFYVMPSGLFASKAGNSLMDVLSVAAFDRKARTWVNRTGPLSLERWGGNIDNFQKDVNLYNQNHAAGLPGDANNLGADKRNVINAFLFGRNAKFEDSNPLRSQLRGADRQGVVRSLRFDRLETMEPGKADITRPDYDKGVKNFSPQAGDESTPEGAAKNIVDQAAAERQMSPKAESNTLYHGTPAEWEEPKLGRPGVFWLTPSEARAQSYARGGSVKSFDGGLSNVADLTTDKNLFRRVVRIYNKDPEIKADPDRAFEPGEDQESLVLNSKNVVDFLKSKGFSGAKAYEYASQKEPSVAVFDTKDLKQMSPKASAPVKKSGSDLEESGKLPYAVGGTIRAYHFSDSKNDLKEVDPSFMRDKVKPLWGSVPKAFLFPEGSQHPMFKGAAGNGTFPNTRLFQADVPADKIYDARTEAAGDPLGYFKDWKGDRDKLDKTLLKAGYNGVLVSTRDGREVLVTYDKHPVTQVGKTDPVGNIKVGNGEIKLKDGLEPAIRWKGKAYPQSVLDKTPGATFIDKLRSKGVLSDSDWVNEDEKNPNKPFGFPYDEGFADKTGKWVSSDKAYTGEPMKRAPRRMYSPEAEAKTKRVANDDVRGVADEYLKGAGLPKATHGGYAPINELASRKIADWYQTALHQPNDPAVKKSYDAFKDETAAQWKAATDAGMKFEPWTKEGQPYKTSAEMSADVRDNKHLWYFPSEGGFGSQEQSSSATHPLLEPSGIKVDGKDVPVNDVFRAVHDYFGHAKEGYEFGPRGELNAFLSHSKMYSDEARPAMAAETMGQNSWVNFGKHLRGEGGKIPGKGEEGYIAPQDRPFAEQKATVMPPELLKDATGGSEGYQPLTEAGRKADANGFKFDVEDFGAGRIELTLKNESGERVGSISASQTSPKSAKVGMINVSPELRRLGIGETLYRELGALCQKKGISELNGSIINDQALSLRKKVFPDTEVTRVKGNPGSPVVGKETTSKISPSQKFSPKSESPFYSQLEKTVEDKFSGKEMPAAQLAAILRNPQNGVKADEMKWTGMDDFLKGKSRVSKQEVLDHLKQNAVKVDEVTKGGSSHFRIATNKEETERHDGQNYVDVIDQKNGLTRFTGSSYEASKWVAENTPSPTKFEEYRTPGGRNYREVLFTLPNTSTGLEGFSPEKIERLRSLESGDITELPKKEFDELQELRRERGDARRKASFRSGHWDEKNVVAHTRLNDRNDTAGKKGLFIEEIQSDWHQKGRKEGYRGNQEAYAEKYQAEVKKAEAAGYTEEPMGGLSAGSYWKNPKGEVVASTGGQGHGTDDPFLQPLVDAYKAGIDNYHAVPDAPFKNTWHEMVFRNLVRKAAEAGKDWLGWTTGEQQAERYDLSKHFDSIDVERENGGSNPTFYLVARSLDGEPVVQEQHLTAKELSDHIGKELADRAVSDLDNSDESKNQAEMVQMQKRLDEIGGANGDKPGSENFRKLIHESKEGRHLRDRLLEMRDERPQVSYDGLDLKVGGEGMKGFYDKMLVDYANKFAKKFGAKVSDREIPTGKYKGQVVTPTEQPNGLFSVKDPRGAHYTDLSRERADGFAKDINDEIGSKPKTVHSIDITPEMKQSVLEKGVPMFSPKAEEPAGLEKVEHEHKAKWFSSRIASATKDKGGITFNVATGKNLSAGKVYGVSIYPDRSEILDPKDVTPETVQKFIKKNADLLSDPNNNVGTWLDKDSGKVYLDVSLGLKDRALAEYAGWKYNQKAIWDSAKAAEIKTGGNGEALEHMPPAADRLKLLQQEYDLQNPKTGQQQIPGMGRVVLNPRSTEVKNVRDLETLRPDRELTPNEQAASDLARKEVRSRVQLLPTIEDKVKVRRALQQGFQEVAEYLKKQAENPNFDTGKDWYGEDIKKTEEITKQIFPETKDSNKMTMFKLLLAAFSGGATPKENYQLASEAFAQYLKTGEVPATSAFRVSETGAARKLGRQGEMTAEKLSKLLEKTGGEAGLVKYLTTKHDETILGNKDAYGALDLGPKFGRFFLNLMGHSDEVTIDLWATRTWRRWMGTPFSRVEGEGGKTKMQMTDVPTDEERNACLEAFASIADEVNKKLQPENHLTPMSVQAMLWYYEKDLYASRGVKVDRGSFSEGAKEYQKNPIHKRSAPVVTGQKVRVDPNQMSLLQ